MKIGGLEIEGVYPIRSKKHGDGYKIRSTRHKDGERLQGQVTYYNKGNLEGGKLYAELIHQRNKLEERTLKRENKKKFVLKKFREIADEHARSKSQMSNGYKVGTARIVRELNAVFGDKYFYQIKRTELEEFIQGMNERTYSKGQEDRHYSDDTLDNYVAAVSAIYDRAIADGQADENPVGEYDLFDLVKGLPAQERIILTPDEDRRFLAELDKMSVCDSIPFYLMRYTGARTCEMAGLNWSLIAPDFSTIRIQYNRIDLPKKTKKKVDRTATKTIMSRRLIPIAAKLREKLMKWREILDEANEGNEQFSESNAVYCDFNGNAKPQAWLNKSLERILNKAGCKRVTCHALRHYWITELGRNGMPTKDIMKLAGHTRIETTERYLHNLSDEDVATRFAQIYAKQEKGAA